MIATVTVHRVERFVSVSFNVFSSMLFLLGQMKMEINCAKKYRTEILSARNGNGEMHNDLSSRLLRAMINTIAADSSLWIRVDDTDYAVHKTLRQIISHFFSAPHAVSMGAYPAYLSNAFSTVSSPFLSPLRS